MSNTYGPRIVSDGLVLHLDAANNRSYVSGNGTIYDLSGNNNTGSLTNGPTYSNNNKGIISFDGTNDYIRVEDAASLRFPSKFTFCIWVKFNSVRTGVGGSFDQLMLKWDDGVGLEYHFALRYAKVSLYLNTSTGVSEAVYGTTTIQINTWYYISAVWDNGVATLYINGIYENSGAKSGTITGTNSPIGICRKNQGAFDPTNGFVGNVAMYNRGLSAAEIKQNYNATKGRYGL